MTFTMCFLRKPSISWIAPLALVLTFVGFFYNGYLCILFFTCLVLILSTYIFTFSNKNHVLEEKLVQNNVFIGSEEDSAPIVHEVVNELEHEETENMSNGKIEKQEENGVDVQIHENLYPENEGIDQSLTSEEEFDSEYWLYSGGTALSPDSTDGTISDEESLIEIALPSGHYVSQKEQEEYHPNLSLPVRQELSNFASDAIFGQFLAEFYEEENLIEIDISMGSIKCSRFEIKA